MQKVKIVEPGTDFIRVSEIIEARKSPAHFRAQMDGKVEREQTRPMLLGTMLHMALLEPKVFAKTYVTAEMLRIPETMAELKDEIKLLGGTPKGKSKESMYEILRSLNPAFRTIDEHAREKKLTLVNESDMEIINGAQDAAWNHPVLGPILKDKENLVCEERLYSMWEVPSGARAKITGAPDGIYLKDQMDMVLEAKLTFSAQPQAFMRNAFDRGWHVQLAAYRKMVSAKYGREFKALWIAIEPKPPHVISLLVPDFAVLDAGEMEMRNLITKIDTCAKYDSWPGPSGSFGAIEVAFPEWTLKQIWEKAGDSEDGPNWSVEDEPTTDEITGEEVANV